MESLIPVVVAFGLCLIVAALIYSYLQTKQRREDLARLADEVSLRYDQDDPFGLADRFSNFGPLAQGHDRLAYNVVHGQFSDHPVKAFDFVYYTTEHSGKTSREVSHYLSVVVFEVGVTFPSLIIRPGNFRNKIAPAPGLDDIKIESVGFNRKFHIKSSDKKFAYDVIHPRMMEFLLGQPRLSLQLEGPVVLVYNGKLLEPKEFKAAMNYANAFLKQIPDFLWERLRGGSL